MNDAENTQDRLLTTEQIAAAGPGTGQDVPAPTGDEDFEGDNPSPAVAGHAASGHADHGVRTTATASATRLTPSRAPACWTTANCGA